MRAVVKHTAGPGGIDLRDVPEPETLPGSVKVAVATVGVCGTDRLALEGAYPYPVPIILGHEVSGTVVEVAADVEGGLAPGDRVTLETDAFIDGTCPYCKVEEYNNCPNRTAIGTTADGGLAEAIVIRAGAVHRLPDSLSLLGGALVEPLAIATHAVVERGAVGPGDLVVVYGPGAIGLLCAQVAGACGARVVLVGRERHAERLDLARGLGVEATVASDADDVAAVVRERSDGYGAHAVIECSGAGVVPGEALGLLRKGGQLVCVAFFSRPPQLDVEKVIKGEVRVIGSRGKRPSSYRRALQLLADGRVDVESLVTHRLPLGDWRAGLDLLGGDARWCSRSASPCRRTTLRSWRPRRSSA